VGLIEAIRDYGQMQSHAFQSFAGMRIEWAICKALRYGGRVHMPADVCTDVRKLRRVMARLTVETGEAPSLEMVAQVMKKSVQEVRGIAECLYVDDVLSLQRSTLDNDDEEAWDLPDRRLIIGLFGKTQ
jgi:DNA-directed RNA polymerase specialized sigma subunit